MNKALQGAAVMLVAASVPAGAATAPVRLVLAGDGLVVGTAKVAFGTPKANALAQVARARGAATKVAVNPDCGSGTAMDYAAFKGGLELDFLGGRLVGWILQEGGSAAIRTAKGVGLGTLRTKAKAAYPAMSVEESSLGTQFTVTSGASGDNSFTGVFRNAAKAAPVAAMWAGQTCIAA